MREVIRAGLLDVGKLKPGAGYVEVTGGLRGVGKDFAAFVRGEAGWKPTAAVSVFGYGQADFRVGSPAEWQAGVGARVTW